VSARHFRPDLTDADPSAWGGLGHLTAPQATCANPGCTKPARERLGDLDEYCSDRCARAHLGTCRGFTCGNIALPAAFGHPGFCSTICMSDRYDEDWR
jgi:hypothetical protein